MDYVIHSMGIPFNGETVKTQSLGGSESAAYFLARELAARGHEVKLFTSHKQGGEWDGVSYIYHGDVNEHAPLGKDFTFYAVNTPHDVLVIQRHPMAFHKDYASKINVWQLHDLALHRTAPMINGGLPRLDMVTAVSSWHAEQIRTVYGIEAPVLKVVPNGVDPAIYATAEGALPAVAGVEWETKFPMLFQSRPERGLEHMVRPGGIMAKLAEAGSKAHLLVCHYEGVAPHMQPFYQQLYQWAAGLPNVTMLGALTKAELAKVQKACALLCYATEFEEVSCITAMESMHAGLPLLTSSVGALPETCKGAGVVLLPLTAEGRADEDKFIQSVRSFETMPEMLHDLAQKQLAAAPSRTWARAVDLFETGVAEAFAARQSSHGSVMRHLIEHSDIVAAVEVGEAPLGNAISKAAAEELATMYAFARPGGDIKAHYAHWEGLNCDRLASEGKPITVEVAQFTTTTRYRGIASVLAQVYNQFTSKPGNEHRRLKVLEYGCAHGHVTLPLAQMLPAADFFGVDFMQRSVNAAREGAEQMGVRNARFEVCDQDSISLLGKHDVIICAEVLEHVWDYRDLLLRLRQQLVPGGTLLLTTPTGRWEWSGHENWKLGREHLHHFEKQDLRDIFAGHDAQFMFAPAGAEETGSGRGSWITAVQFNDAHDIGTVDYARKFAQIAPRQTISLCMIVKDAQDTIRKAIASALPYADEVIVAVDPRTKDHTRERIEELRAEWPQTPFTVIEGLPATEAGFGAARNRTIDLACGDWILWMDADEEMSGAANMWRVARPSNFNAYGTPQRHYSSDPPAVLTTDFPCRLFRNYRGARFYGLVHEHPEDKPGDAIARSSMLPDVSFLHAGYVNEPTRRARFHRNYPLLLRDMKENPDRLLNRFLYMRDMAQSVQFEAEQTGGAMTPEMVARCEEGIAAFKTILDTDKPVLRMIIDGLQYYSLCVAALQRGFEVDAQISVKRDDAPALATNMAIKGRFHDRATYDQLMAKVQQESTRHYESKHL